MPALQTIQNVRAGGRTPINRREPGLSNPGFPANGLAGTAKRLPLVATRTYASSASRILIARSNEGKCFRNSEGLTASGRLNEFFPFL